MLDTSEDGAEAIDERLDGVGQNVQMQRLQFRHCKSTDGREGIQVGVGDV
jgi:hypothetical protein